MGRQTYTWNNTQLSREQVAQVLYQAGLTNPQAIAQLIPIAMRESGGRAGVHGSDSPRQNLTGDRGLFQINSTHDKRLMQAGIIRSPQDLFDPVTNARAAAYLSNQGDPRMMRQLWGLGRVNGRTTWVGSSGSLPPPDTATVQRAQQSGILTRPYQGGGGGVPPITDPVAGWLAGQPGGQSAAGQFYDILNAQNLANIQAGNAYTQMQSGYASQMAGLEQQLLGIGQQQNQYDLQALDVEQGYKDSLALLNAGLSEKQQATNLKTWRELAKNTANLRTLSTQGMQNSKEYYEKSNKLEKDIRAATEAWIGKQVGFTRQDYTLAMQAINNVLTTETARWGEIQRLTGAEKKLAAADFNQAKSEAQFTEDVQRRKQISDATARGAMTSKGQGQALGEFEQQRTLGVSAAQNDFNSALEQITQAYNQGKISYQDAQRETLNARSRAGLNRDAQLGQLAYQGQQAWQQYQGNTLANQQQWRNQYLQYQNQQEGLRNQQSQGYINYYDNYSKIKAQAQQNAATQAYNQAMYPINRAGIQNTGRRYGIEAAQSSAQLGNTLDNLAYQNAQNIFGSPVYTPSFENLSPYSSTSSSRPRSTGRASTPTANGRPRSSTSPYPV